MKRPALTSRFWRSDTGVAAVEFALCLPLLTLLYLGGFEATDAVSTYRKLADTTVTLANVSAQYQTMAASDVQTVFAASAQVMSPYPTTQLGVVLSEVAVTPAGVATVSWSCGYNGSTALPVGKVMTLPAGLWTASQANIVGTINYVLVQTTYQFALPTGYAFSHALSMSDQIYMLPRASSAIANTGCP